MPRNDQTVRQHIVFMKLGSSRYGLTLEQLADGLDPSLTRHPRTLRRDLDAIESAGWPLLTERIGGPTRWKLLDCVRNAPALRLSPTELMALALSRRLVAPLEGTAVYASLQSALNKASAALPAEGLLMVHQLKDTFSVGLGPHKRYKHHRDIVERVVRVTSDVRISSGTCAWRDHRNQAKKQDNGAAKKLIWKLTPDVTSLCETVAIIRGGGYAERNMGGHDAIYRNHGCLCRHGFRSALRTRVQHLQSREQIPVG